MRLSFKMTKFVLVVCNPHAFEATRELNNQSEQCKIVVHLLKFSNKYLFISCIK